MSDERTVTHQRGETTTEGDSTDDERDDIDTLTMGPSTDERVGTALGAFRLERLISRSTNSRVYLARHLEQGSRHAIKMLRRNASPRSVKRLEREARALSELEHPNIVRVVDYGMTADGEAYLVTEFFDGRTVFEEIRDRGPMSTSRVLAIAKEIASGLAHAHARGIVHRDLKPGNVLLVDAGVKLLDFGIAKLAELDPALSQLTRAVQILGTPNYMAPEQISTPRDATSKSDIYSLGALMFRMATGAPPYRGDRASVIQQHLTSSPPELGGPLGGVIRRLMAKDPKSRPTTQELVAILEEAQPSDRREVETATDVRSAERKTRRVAVILMITAAFLLGLYISSRRDWPLVPKAPIDAPPQR